MVFLIFIIFRCVIHFFLHTQWGGFCGLLYPLTLYTCIVFKSNLREKNQPTESTSPNVRYCLRQRGIAGKINLLKFSFYLLAVGGWGSGPLGSWMKFIFNHCTMLQFLLFQISFTGGRGADLVVQTVLTFFTIFIVFTRRGGVELLSCTNYFDFYLHYFYLIKAT